MIKIKLFQIILVCIFLGLLACSDAVTKEKSTAVEVVSQQSVLTNSHQQKIYQKPGAGIRLLTSQQIQVDRDEHKEVTFTFIAQARSGELTLTVQPSDGLVIDNISPTYVYDLPLKSIELPLSIQGLTEGEQTLHFTAELNGKRRTMGVLVWVGDLALQVQAAQEKAAQVQDAPSVISLPAVEVVKTK